MSRIEEIRTWQHRRDISAIAKVYYDECMPKAIPFDEEAVALSFQVILEDPSRSKSNAWLVYQDDEAIGFLLGSANRIVYCWDVAATLDNLYILPEKRGGLTALKLIREFEEWARVLGCVQIFLGVHREDDLAAMERTGKLFEKIGYSLAGHYYVKTTIGG